jgi:hypothetical protein
VRANGDIQLDGLDVLLRLTPVLLRNHPLLCLRSVLQRLDLLGLDLNSALVTLECSRHSREAGLEVRVIFLPVGVKFVYFRQKLRQLIILVFPILRQVSFFVRWPQRVIAVGIIDVISNKRAATALVIATTAPVLRLPFARSCRSDGCRHPAAVSKTDIKTLLAENWFYLKREKFRATKFPAGCVKKKRVRTSTGSTPCNDSVHSSLFLRPSGWNGTVNVIISVSSLG